MQLAWLGFGVFFGVSLAVGVRVLARAWRTERAPELLIGLALLGILPLGFGLQTLALALIRHPAAEALATGGAGALAIGLWAQLAFNWLVFRRGSSIAAIVTGVLSVAVGVQLLAQPLHGSFLEAAQNLKMGAPRSALQVAALGWGAVEALVYWARLRRRRRLDLADPGVLNRFLLCGLSTGSACLGGAIGLAHSLATGRSPSESPALLATLCASGGAAALTAWLAFDPPRGYLRWLATFARSEGTQSGA